VVAGVFGVAWIAVIFITAVNNKHVTRTELGETGKKVYRHRPTKEKERMDVEGERSSRSLE